MNQKALIAIGIIIGLLGVIAGIYNWIEFADYQGRIPKTELQEKLYEIYDREYVLWSNVTLIAGFVASAIGAYCFKKTEYKIRLIPLFLGFLCLLLAF